MIASGPAYPDSSTSADALNIADKYNLKLSEQAKALLSIETPKELSNVITNVTGSVRELCRAAEKACINLGYNPIVLTDCLGCEAREAGKFLASIARFYSDTKESLAFIAGGETVVHLVGQRQGRQKSRACTGRRRGGLRALLILPYSPSARTVRTARRTPQAAMLIITPLKILRLWVLTQNAILKNNDAYNALIRCGGLIVTRRDWHKRQRCRGFAYKKIVRVI